MKNLTKTTLIMSTILLMVVVPNAFANTVTDKSEYDKCKNVISFPQGPHAKTTTKTSKIVLEVWDQNWSNLPPHPKFIISYDFPQYITEVKKNKCVNAWELVDIDLDVGGLVSVDKNGHKTIAMCYSGTFDASENKKVKKKLTCASGFGMYMNSDRDIYMSLVPTYVNLSNGNESTHDLHVISLTAQAD